MLWAWLSHRHNIQTVKLPKEQQLRGKKVVTLKPNIGSQRNFSILCPLLCLPPRSATFILFSLSCENKTIFYIGGVLNGLCPRLEAPCCGPIFSRVTSVTFAKKTSEGVVSLKCLSSRKIVEKIHFYAEKGSKTNCSQSERVYNYEFHNEIFFQNCFAWDKHEDVSFKIKIKAVLHVSSLYTYGFDYFLTLRK